MNLYFDGGIVEGMFWKIWKSFVLISFIVIQFQVLLEFTRENFKLTFKPQRDWQFLPENIQIFKMIYETAKEVFKYYAISLIYCWSSGKYLKVDSNW